MLKTFLLFNKIKIKKLFFRKRKWRNFSQICIDHTYIYYYYCYINYVIYFYYIYVLFGKNTDLSELYSTSYLPRRRHMQDEASPLLRDSYVASLSWQQRPNHFFYSIWKGPTIWIADRNVAFTDPHLYVFIYFVLVTAVVGVGCVR